jgi:hypothetical protein
MAKRITFNLASTIFADSENCGFCSIELDEETSMFTGRICEGHITASQKSMKNYEKMAKIRKATITIRRSRKSRTILAGASTR